MRAIDRFVDLGGIGQHLAPFYSNTGRPSVDPELTIRMLLIGYCFGIRSERRICDEVHLNLAYRWFCRRFHAGRQKLEGACNFAAKAVEQRKVICARDTTRLRRRIALAFLGQQTAEKRTALAPCKWFGTFGQ